MMDAKTAAALEASILHWKQNADVETLQDAKITSSFCALCALFADDDCDGCPVKERTRLPQCQEAPWDEAYSARNRNYLAAFRIAALDEVEFLESLREPVGQENDK